ncbi:protein FAM78B-like isoform X2 [Acanthaster planci]|uniref:Protein FAM78B-like isoform X2 n=1 Tax=Acanthaster planci TaxID=133434 RepID=A0A8B7XY11_ACAPL|nr:protein FAM78B-like isoform X2 [Acanthaster planci]
MYSLGRNNMADERGDDRPAAMNAWCQESDEVSFQLTDWEEEANGRAHYAPRLLQHLPMGCILPKRQKNLGLEGDIKVYDLHAIIDPHPTTLIENSPTVLKYQTPHFRASARVRFPPVSGNDTWQIGWVQGCSNMDFTISYGNLGTSSWEIPSLKSNQQRFVSDSDGKHYPWYGCTTEVATIPGPTSCYSTFHLRMNDNFHPSITWDIPVRNSHQVRLTKLARDQSFTVWLVAMNKSTGQKFVLRTIKWRMRINIAVDETQPLGRRARLLDPIIQEQPHILEPWQNEVAPPEALRAPNANNAQTLIWRPTSGGEVVIVPPVSHH